LRDDGILEFDHRTIIRDARRTARQQLEDTPIALKFCKHEFTLTDLRWVYEAFVLDKVDPANFRRKVEQANDFVRAADAWKRLGELTKAAGAFERAGRISGVLGCSEPRRVMQYRRLIGAGTPFDEALTAVE
jgi:hypothetical protein